MNNSSLLAALWNHAILKDTFYLHSPKLTEYEAELELIANNNYIEQLYGRDIYVDFNNPDDLREYDKRNPGKLKYALNRR